MNDGAASAPAGRVERLFVALALDERARAAVARIADRLQAAGASGRRVPASNYHLIVAFLGLVQPAAVPAVGAAVRAAAARAEGFDLRLARAGGFPSDARARVVWLGPPAPSARFTALARDVRAALVPLGFTFDAGAVPHVTLFRATASSAVPRWCCAVPSPSGPMR